MRAEILYTFGFLLSVVSASCKNASLTNQTSDLFSKEVIAAYVAAGAALIVGLITLTQFLLNRRDQKIAEVNRNVWDGLKWFEGGTQKRSIGIAIIEAYWNDKKRIEFKKVWVPLLINQTIHILKASDEKHKATEQVNLERIIKLLKKTALEDNQKGDIRDALTQANYINENEVLVKVLDKGIYIKIMQRETWVKDFQ